MNEEGLFGSRYEARVLEMDVEQVLVQFSEFVSEEDPKSSTRGVGRSRSRHAGTAARATRLPRQRRAGRRVGDLLRRRLVGGEPRPQAARRRVPGLPAAVRDGALGQGELPAAALEVSQPRAAKWTADSFANSLESVGLTVYDSSLDARQEQPRDDDDNAADDDERRGGRRDGGAAARDGGRAGAPA